MELKLGGRVALVTGASSGIGWGIAHVLASEGAELIVVARREGRLQSLVGELGGKGRFIAADLSDPDGSRRVVQSALALCPRIDILVNNAGTSLPMSVVASDGAWQEAFGLQFHAVRILTEGFLPAMRSAHWGRIINVGGTLEPSNQVNGSTVAKAAMVAWAKGLSREVGRDGVTVNTVIPGRVMSEQIVQRVHPSKAEREAFAVENIPVGYFGEPVDVGWLVAFLASPIARYITGGTIHVDGGLHRYAF